MINGLNRLHRVDPLSPRSHHPPPNRCCCDFLCSGNWYRARQQSSTNGSWSVSGTLRHKIALRRIQEPGAPSSRRILAAHSTTAPTPHSLLPHPKSYALWPPGVALKSLFRCGTATPGEGPLPAPRDDDARNPMPAHSIPSIPSVPFHVDPFPGVCLLSFIGVVCFLPVLLVSVFPV